MIVAQPAFAICRFPGSHLFHGSGLSDNQLKVVQTTPLAVETLAGAAFVRARSTDVRFLALRPAKASDEDGQ